jgi:hypothetical protein
MLAVAHYRIVAVLVLLLPVVQALLAGRSAADALGHLVISEVFYDASQTGTDSHYEWVEVFNPTDAPVDLAGWRLRDNTEAMPSRRP